MKRRMRLVILAMLMTLSCSIVVGEAPYAADAPRFTKPGQSVLISAYAPGSEIVALSWKGAKGSGDSTMSYNPSTGHWEAEIPAEDVVRPSLQYRIHSWDGEKTQESPEYTVVVSSEYTTIAPTPMKLVEKVLAKRKWNTGPDAFGILTIDGDTAGPASIVYSRGVIYLLDSIYGRILAFDKEGKTVSMVVLPETDTTDLLIGDPSTSSLLVVNQLQETVYQVTEDEVNLLATIGGLRRMVMPAKFVYSKPADTLFAEDPLTNTLVRVMKDGAAVDVKDRRTKERLSTTAEVSGKNLILGLKAGKSIISVTMDKQITGVEEVVTDHRGIVWVLYSLDGDYRTRRLARVDASKGTAEVAEAKDVWFYAETTRHMAGMENGVVLFASDEKEGRIVTYEFEGGGLQ